MRLLGRLTSINVRKAAWTLDEIGASYEREDWGGEFRSTRDAAYLALNPKGLVPVLIDGDLVLSESNTMMRYLAGRFGRVDLLPVEPAARARVEEWIDWQATDLNTGFRYAFQGLSRRNPAFSDEKAIADSVRQWNRLMGLVEAQLQKTGAYVAGPDFTLADIAIGLSVNRWRHTLVERPEMPAVEAYLARLTGRPAAAPHFGAAMA